MSDEDVGTSPDGCTVCGTVPELACVRPIDQPHDAVLCVDCYARVFAPDFNEEFELV